MILQLAAADTIGDLTISLLSCTVSYYSLDDVR